MSRRLPELQSDSYREKPVVKSTYSYSLHSEILKICEHLDYNHPLFRSVGQPVEARRRSAGTAQRLIVTLALQHKPIIDQLKLFMWEGGRYYNYTGFSENKIDLDRYKKRR
jgi:hypothetical protein